MKENPKRRIEAIVDALLESDQRESTARYLTSGRRFAHLRTEEIKERWTQAARTFLISYGGVSPREMDDLSSEQARRALRGRQDGEHGPPSAVIAQAPRSAQDAFAVLRQNLKFIRIHAVRRIGHFVQLWRRARSPRFLIVPIFCLSLL
jgi:hypothetical protein